MISALKKIKQLIFKYRKDAAYDFNRSNPLGGNGERVDITFNKNIDFKSLDIYQKSHWNRYQYAKEIIHNDDTCGDFACGTGYGTVLLSEKAATVTGIDSNAALIEIIKKRYKDYDNIRFLHEDLLHLDFTGYFNCIVSFETLEHFDEKGISTLLRSFHMSLQHNGTLIFSTPYMQEESAEAKKMGFHLTFLINETKIKNWLDASGFYIDSIRYQNYETHLIEEFSPKKDFIIIVAKKKTTLA